MEWFNINMSPSDFYNTYTRVFIRICTKVFTLWGAKAPSLCYFPSLVAQLVKKPPAIWETLVRSVGQEDSLEKEKATHSSILVWKIPWTVSSMGSQRVAYDWVTFTFSHFSFSEDPYVKGLLKSNVTVCQQKESSQSSSWNQTTKISIE